MNTWIPRFCLPARRLVALLVAIGTLAIASPSAAQDATPGIPAHDPVMAEQDGTYYLFTTGEGITMWSSPDRETWTRQGAVFDEPPSWATEVVPEFDNSIWAPDIAEHDGTYYLYYAVSSFGSNASAIGVATSPTLNPDANDYGWTDHGIVVESVPGRDAWNAIDANLIVAEDGQPWLTFGSFWSGVKLVEMATPPTELAEDAEWHNLAGQHRYRKLDPRDAGDRMNGAIEAPFLFKHGDYYYLFASWGLCCRGEESTYKVVVGRSQDITGPYLDKEDQEMRLGGGSLVVDGNERWAGVGHSAAYTFDGTDYLAFHGYDRQDDGNSKLWIREIEWFHGWPKVSLE
ncbi:arabinan endo-1,5-alpha-L-arabinosidase [Longimonas halophila]|nr:arabinan endo-1,5-alpha-L-arabinosidase [Longimonas halophila]